MSFWRFAFHTEIPYSSIDDSLIQDLDFALGEVSETAINDVDSLMIIFENSIDVSFQFEGVSDVHTEVFWWGPTSSLGPFRV